MINKFNKNKIFELILLKFILLNLNITFFFFKLIYLSKNDQIKISEK